MWSSRNIAVAGTLIATLALVVARATPHPPHLLYRQNPYAAYPAAGPAAALSRRCFVWHPGRVMRNGMFTRYEQGYYVRRGC